MARDKRTDERGGIDGGTTVLRDRNGEIFAVYIADDTSPDGYVRLDADGNEVFHLDDRADQGGEGWTPVEEQ